MKRLKILCEDVFDCGYFSVYVCLFFSLHTLAVCNPWGHGGGGEGRVIISTCRYQIKSFIF